MKRRSFLGLILGWVTVATGKWPKARIRPRLEERRQQATEDATLGAILTTPEMAPTVLSIVDMSHFISSPQNALLFSEIGQLHRKRVAATLPALRESLESRGLLEYVGGHERLIELLEYVPNPNNARAYAESLVDLKNTRAMRL